MSGSFIYGTGCFLSGGLCMINEQASMDPFRIMAFTEAERKRETWGLALEGGTFTILDR